MPTWRIQSYRFYFHVGEVWEPHKPPHIHVRLEGGQKIQFWLTNFKVKKVEGKINLPEETKITNLVRENAYLFLQEWERIKNQHQ
ncbi:MAG: DUF4160 domain-containing protein [Spiroplasmataceae bacterium]|nr:DUF4160 domain-containing protein [Spiroplasmataceae bacterium]